MFIGKPVFMQNTCAYTRYFKATCTSRWIPLLALKKNRPVTHALFATINLIVASTFAFTVTELSVQRRTRMSFDSVSEYGYEYILRDLGVAIVFQCIAEYYWHRYVRKLLSTFNDVHKHLYLHMYLYCLIANRTKIDAYALLLSAIAQVPPSLQVS